MHCRERVCVQNLRLKKDGRRATSDMEMRKTARGRIEQCNFRERTYRDTGRINRQSIRAKTQGNVSKPLFLSQRHEAFGLCLGHTLNIDVLKKRSK